MTLINILFFLTPKAEVAFLEDDYSLRQSLEKMEHHQYSSIPILNRDGEYSGTITEGDILWYFHKADICTSIKQSENIRLTDIPRRLDYEPVNASSNMEDLFSKIVRQNFVPVVDDCDKFIGIIKRKDVIRYYYEHSGRN